MAAVPGALATCNRLVVGEGVVADEDVVHGPLRRRRNPAFRRLGERPEQDVCDPLARLDVARGDGCRWKGGDDASRPCLQSRHAVAAPVCRDGRVGDHPQRVVQTGSSHRLHRVEVRRHLIIAVGEVRHDAIGIDVQVDPDRHVGSAELHVVGETERARVELGDRCGHPALAVSEDLPGGPDEAIDVFAHEVAEPPHRHLIRAQLRGEIAPTLVRRARGLQERLQKLVEPLAGPHGRHRRHDDPLLMDVRRMGGHRARRFTADIGMVGAVADPGEQPARLEHGLDDRQIVQMGSPLEWVVHRILHARLGIEAVDHGPNGGRHGSEMNGDVLGLGEHVPFGREHRGGAVRSFLDVRGICGSAEHDPHFVRNSAQSVPGDLEIDGGHRHCRNSSSPPISTIPRWPTGTQIVEPPSSTSAGP